MASPTETLRKLEFTFSFSADETVLSDLQALGHSLGQNEKATHSSCLASGSLLSVATSEPLYLWFHADKETGSEDGKHVFCHLIFRPRPAGDPPEPLGKLFKEGKTADWLLGELGRLAKGANIYVLMDAKLRLESWERQKTAMMVAKPLSTGDSILELCGAQYETKQHSLGLSKFRWSESEGQITTWITYMIETKVDQLINIDKERQRCREYLKELI